METMLRAAKPKDHKPKMQEGKPLPAFKSGHEVQLDPT